MPLRFMRGGAAELTLTVAAIACGVGLVCALDLAGRGAVRAFAEVIDGMAGRAALQVTAGDGGFLEEDVAAAVAAVPGVKGVLPVVDATVFIADDADGDSLTVHAVDLASDVAGELYGMEAALLESPLEFLARPDSLALTRAFATSHGLAVGDRLELVTPVGRQSFAIRALLEPSGLARTLGGRLAVMDLFSAQPIFTRPGLVTGIDVLVERTADLSALTNTVAAVLPPGLRVSTPAERQADLQRVMQALPVALRGMGLFCLVAAFLVTFNRLSTVFEARSGQLGVLRALGVRGRIVWRELLKESLVIGAAGVALGVPLGIGLGRLLLPVIARTAALNYDLVAPETAVVLDAASIAKAAALGLLAAVLAATLPAWRTSRVAPAATLRTRGTEAPDPAAGIGQMVPGLMLGGLLVACATRSLEDSVTPGLVGTTLVGLATAAAAGPALGVLRLVRLPAVRRVIGPIVWFAAQNLLCAPRRTRLTVATIGVGLASAVGCWTIAASFQRSLVTTLSQAIRPDLVVTSAHAAGRSEAPLAPSVERALAGVPGVLRVGGSRSIDWPHEGERVTLNAIDPRYFTSERGGRWPLFGSHLPDVWQRIGSGEAVLVSSSFVTRFGARVGESIVLETPRGPRRLQVGGVTSSFESPGGTVVLSRDVYRRHWRDHQVNRIGVYVRTGVEVAAVRAAIEHELARPYGLRVLLPRELIAHYSAEAGRGFAPVYLLAGMVIMVILMAVADTLAAAVLERTRDLCTLRALGVRVGSVRRMTLVEAGLLGCLGFVVAAAGGLAMGSLWVTWTLPALLGWSCQLRLPWREIPIMAVVTVVVCLTASLLPVRRAARLRPHEALRYE